MTHVILHYITKMDNFGPKVKYKDLHKYISNHKGNWRNLDPRYVLWVNTSAQRIL